MSDDGGQAIHFAEDDNSLLDDIDDTPPEHPPPKTPASTGGGLGTPSFTVIDTSPSSAAAAAADAADAPPVAALGSTAVTVINMDSSSPSSTLSKHTFEEAMAVDASQKRVLLLRRVVSIAAICWGGLMTALFAFGFVLAITKSFPHPMLFFVGGAVAFVGVIAFLLNLTASLLPTAPPSFYLALAAVQSLSLILSIVGAVFWGLIIDEDARAVVVVLATVSQFLSAAFGTVASVYMVMYPAQTGADGKLEFTLLLDGTPLPTMTVTLPPLFNVVGVLFGVTAILLMFLFWPLTGSIHYALVFSWSLSLLLMGALVILGLAAIKWRSAVLNAIQLAVSTVAAFIVTATVLVILLLAIIAHNGHVLLMEFPLLAAYLSLVLSLSASGMRWLRDRSKQPEQPAAGSP